MTVSTSLQVLLPVLVVAGIMVLRIWFWAKVHRFFAQRDSRGREVEPTPEARFALANLPLDASLVARTGAGGEAQYSLNARVMRPTFGLRVLSLGLGGLLLAMIWTDAGADFISGPAWAMQVISGFVLYSMIYIMQYELRYDDHSFVAPDWFLRRREYLWKDLVAIRDDGHYLYKLRFADGRKMEVQKYLVGIGEFLSIAHERIERNRSGN